jgi:hypothetical protein
MQMFIYTAASVVVAAAPFHSVLVQHAASTVHAYICCACIRSAQLDTS